MDTATKQEGQPIVKSASHNKYLLSIFTVGIITFLIGFAVGHYSMFSTKENLSSTNPSLSQVKNSKFSPTPTIATDPYQKNDQGFVKRHFTQKQKVFAYDQSAQNPNYSSLSFLNIEDNQVIPTQCTQFYEDNIYGPSNPYFYLNTANDNDSPVIEPDLRAMLLEPQKKNLPNNYLQVALFCKTIDNRIIAQYGTWKNIHWGFRNESVDQNLKTVANFNSPSEGTYFRCRTPLFLTSSNILYVNCDSTNGNMSSERKDFSYIYSVDLNSGDVNLKLRCQKDFTNKSISCSQ